MEYRGGGVSKNVCGGGGGDDSEFSSYFISSKRSAANSYCGNNFFTNKLPFNIINLYDQASFQWNININANKSIKS